MSKRTPSVKNVTTSTRTSSTVVTSTVVSSTADRVQENEETELRVEVVQGGLEDESTQDRKMIVIEKMETPPR